MLTSYFARPARLPSLVGFILVVLGCWLAISPVAAASPDDPPGRGKHASGQILVKFRHDLDPTVGRLLSGAAEAEAAPRIRSIGVQRYRVPTGREREFVDRFRRNPLVDYAELDYLVSVAVAPSDPYVTDGQQWHLSTIDAPLAWEVTTGAENSVTIAIVDTGIDGRHPDLTGRVTDGYDVIGRRAIAAGTNSDDYWHGTHVAGIAGARANNGLGGTGISWSANLMPIKVLDATGYGTYSDLAEGIIWAVDHGARVVNLSLGGPAGTDTENRTLEAAVDYAWQKNVLLVAAAGNFGGTPPESGGNVPSYPGAVEKVVAVAATTLGDGRAYFSNYGAYVDLAAPGTSIMSTIPNAGYTSRSGTSMSTPVVSGVAALLLAVDPSLTPAQLTRQLENASVDLGTAGKDTLFGWGRISAARALLPGSIALDSNHLAIAGPSGGAGTATLTIKTKAAGKISWRARSNVDWIKLSGAATTNGQVGAQSSSELQVSIDWSKVPAGTRSGTFQVGAVLGDDWVTPQTVQVDLVAPRMLFLPTTSRQGRE